MPTHFPLTVRCQYFSRSSLVENCSPSEYSNGVRPTRISKKVTPSDQTSDLRVSWGRPRARSGERYCRVQEPFSRVNEHRDKREGACSQARCPSWRAREGKRDVLPGCRMRDCYGRLRATRHRTAPRSRSRQARGRSRPRGECSQACLREHHAIRILGITTHLISLCTTPRLCRNSTPDKSERNHSFACRSETSTVMSRGWYALCGAARSEESPTGEKDQSDKYMVMRAYEGVMMKE